MLLLPDPCRQAAFFSIALASAAEKYGEESIEFCRVLEETRLHYQQCKTCRETIHRLWEYAQTTPIPDDTTFQTDDKPAWGKG